MIVWTAAFADGWYPKLSPEGGAVLCGSKTVRVVRAGQVVEFGPPQRLALGWLNEMQAVVSADLTGTDTQWATARLDGPFLGDRPPVPIGPVLNFAGAGGNLWAGGNTHTIWVGDPDGHARPIADGYAATVDETGLVVYSVDVHTTPRLVTWRNGQIGRTIAPAVVPSKFLCGAGGYVGYGYYGPAWLNLPDNRNVEVSVTPDRKETPPLAFRHLGAIWLATAGDRGVYLRPFGVRNRAITIPIPATDCSVVSTGAQFVVACSNAVGRLSLVHVPAETALLPVAGPEAPPVEPPVVVPPPVAPKATIAFYEASVTRPAKARAVARVTQGAPDQFRWQYQDGGTWVTAATNPARDLDHHYAFPRAGRFPIRLQTLKAGVVTDTTGSLRVVTVS